MDLGIASFDDTTLDAKARREDIRDYLRVVFGTLWSTIYVRVWFDDECEFCGKRETEPESCDCLDDNSTTQTKVN
ncbi:MAG: hypothetical protein QGD93_12335 [Actinomycetota bacterium]|nr:hypothetical protein [Actinomycetota bacterium]